MVPGISMPEVPTSLTALMVPGISMPEGVPQVPMCQFEPVPKIQREKIINF